MDMVRTCRPFFPHALYPLPCRVRETGGLDTGDGRDPRQRRSAGRQNLSAHRRRDEAVARLAGPTPRRHRHRGGWVGGRRWACPGRRGAACRRGWRRQAEGPLATEQVLIIARHQLKACLSWFINTLDFVIPRPEKATAWHARVRPDLGGLCSQSRPQPQTLPGLCSAKPSVCDTVATMSQTGVLGLPDQGTGDR